MKISDAVFSALSIPRSSLIRSAHLLERIGLAAVGGACGLYVGALLLRLESGLFESSWIVLLAMLYGALSYYVGIDLAGNKARKSSSGISEEWDGSDAPEIISAAGTFGAAMASALSVSILVLDQNVPGGVIAIVAGCWLAGSTLQVVAGTMARARESADKL